MGNNDKEGFFWTLNKMFLRTITLRGMAHGLSLNIYGSSQLGLQSLNFLGVSPPFLACVLKVWTVRGALAVFAPLTPKRWPEALNFPKPQTPRP